MSLPTIAVDAMGGDEGVRVMVEGAALARRRHASFRFLLVGDEKRLASALDDHPDLRGAADILHAPEAVAGDEKPTQALRRAKVTSMGLAIDAVKRGEAGAAVSAGNTGALMAMAKLALRTLPGIDRPALAALVPTMGAHDLVMLDLGANTECDARNLYQFAIMGAAYARIVNGLESPCVRLLNIGTEETKGTGHLRDAAALLKEASGNLALTFDGFTEADKLSRGDFDVAVTDGFSGNVALKAMEGAARFVGDLLRRSFSSSLRSKLGFLISRPATDLLRHHLDPNQHNGAVFLGLNGVVVKSHGGASAVGMANAIAVATRLVEENLIERISADVAAVDPDTIRQPARRRAANTEGETAL
ncbi:phosphate acyltransferase PlsX [Novosphingobium pituita]|uniref:Phosphate acyltransferase n=1 Tax=Novosphingobium pituita TaxID=3056842 RepID=A0ABQ6P4Z0_9SPHN|nr:phosphate acyltransferase PlsX [Novosphingobium sp. IK01]GMM60333.1 phosphate acyltransferase PlsX [Novosphingobium sp. IK01]